MVLLTDSDFERATYSYLVPLGDLTLAQRSDIRTYTDRALIQKAVDLTIKNDPKDLIVREALPYTDLAMADSGAAHDDSWIIPNAGVVGTDANYFANTIPTDHIVAFYGLAVEGPINAVSRVKFGIGTSASLSTLRAIFQIEELYSRLEQVGYFSEPVLFVRNDNASCFVMPRIAFAAYAQRLCLLARTAEPVGTTISVPSV